MGEEMTRKKGQKKNKCIMICASSYGCVYKNRILTLALRFKITVYI